MSEFQICACGSAPGYPHRADCPRPLYNPSDAQFEAWEKDWLNMKTQHTPGEWKITGQLSSFETHTIRAVCDEPGKRFEFWVADCAKNCASLIASAPQLLAACKEAKAWLSPRASQFGASAESAQYVLNLCETAIAKATKT